MNKITSVDVISYLLILLFVYTGASKLMTYQHFHTQLIKQLGERWYTNILTIGVPVIELVIAASLLFISFRKWGLYASFLLMSVFTLYVGLMIAFVSVQKLPCTCGGVIQLMSWNQHLVFNIFFTFLAFLGIWLDRRIAIKELTKTTLS